MAQLRGLLSIDELADRVESGGIDTVIVAFTDHYGRVHGKRFDATFFLDDVAGVGTHGCDYLLTVDMEMEPVPGYKYSSWELGYGDFHMVPDISTLREASWLQLPAIVLCYL
ncbi:MAG: glutamine synthetase, partial [Acidobacteria bacterium]|nr:glutamine synthetase [Acidobacteriota bacterium]